MAPFMTGTVLEVDGGLHLARADLERIARHRDVLPDRERVQDGRRGFSNQ